MPGRACRIALLYAAALPVPATILVLLAPDLPSTERAGPRRGRDQPRLATATSFLDLVSTR
jgi:hypothetical protein